MASIDLNVSSANAINGVVRPNRLPESDDNCDVTSMTNSMPRMPSFGFAALLDINAASLISLVDTMAVPPRNAGDIASSSASFVPTAGQSRARGFSLSSTMPASPQLPAAGNSSSESLASRTRRRQSHSSAYLAATPDFDHWTPPFLKPPPTPCIHGTDPTPEMLELLDHAESFALPPAFMDVAAYCASEHLWKPTPTAALHKA